MCIVYVKGDSEDGRTYFESQLVLKSEFIDRTIQAEGGEGQRVRERERVREKRE